ncbi:MAG TPA: hypothetical protein VF915_17925 [Reyranella sp.]
MTIGRGAPAWVATARDLYLVAMAVFVVNIVIGILNGADVVEFDRNQLLTHVHAGTVGWLTLSIVASTFLLFRAADRRLMIALVVLVPIYVFAFYTGSFPFRAIGGSALLVAVGWILWWVWQQYLAGERSLPRLAVALGLTTFGYGALVGVIIQISFAAGRTILPGDPIGAHAGAMTFGYLVLVAMGFIEWRLLGTRDLPRGGLVQIGALFLGGLTISISLLVDAVQIGGGIYLLTQLVAIALFVARVWPRSLRIGWLAPNPIRHFAASSIWVVAALVIYMYIVFLFMQNPTDFSALPINILIASDHAAYIGILTNIALGLLTVLLLRAGVRRGWVGHVIFWGVNLGLLVFVIGLIVNTAELKRLGAPVMGITLLVALGILAYTALREPLEASEADIEPA